MIGWNRLRRGYVEGSGRDTALAKSVGEGRGIDQIAPGDVDQDHARPHPVDGVTIDIPRVRPVDGQCSVIRSESSKSRVSSTGSQPGS